MSDYPKIMTRGGDEISVGGAADEAVKRGEGWCSPLDVAGETVPSLSVYDPNEPDMPEAVEDLALPDEPEGPTFGPPHDQTHAKRKGAAKKR